MPGEVIAGEDRGGRCGVSKKYKCPIPYAVSSVAENEFLW
jgi:hypothetical protein